jgi:hypothetical protein
MFLRMKIQKIMFQETHKQRGTQSSTTSSQIQLFNYEDVEFNQTKSNQHLSAHSFFQTQRVATIVRFSM